MGCLAMFGMAWLVGLSICRAVLGAAWRESPWTLRLGLGWAAGAAFGGLTTFWATVLAPTHRSAVVGAAAVVGLSLLFIRSTPSREEAPTPEVLPDPDETWERVARTAGVLAFGAVLGLWVAFCLKLGVRAPAGGWDAFSIWTQRARFLYLCPEEWTRALDPALEWSHPEYPNLVPGLVAYGWLPEGRCVAASPVLVALLTQVGKLLLIVGLGRAAYPRSAWPWVFGVFYATIPQAWTQEEAWQYADRPLALFLLAGIGCLALGIRRGQRSWYALAGLFWGAAAFCKDEGKAALLVLGVGASLATACALAHGGGWRAIGNLALLGFGLVPGLGSLALQWAYSPVPTKLLERMTASPLHDRERTRVIVRFLADRLDHPQWGGMWWGCALALVLLAPWLRRRELWILWIFPAVQLFIYLTIFQLTPHPLEWHLRSALPRLLFHIGPIVFVAASWLVLECQQATWPASDEEPG